MTEYFGKVFVIISFCIILGACATLATSPILDPVSQARGDAIRIQAEADRQTQLMYANQDAADRTQARNQNLSVQDLAILLSCGVGFGIITVGIIFVLAFMLRESKKEKERENNYNQITISKSNDYSRGKNPYEDIY